MSLGNLGTYYVPEGETRTITVETVDFDGEETPLAFIDGSALYLLCRVEEADHDGVVLLKQFGADRLLLAGLHPDHLDPGQEVKIRRYEGGGYDVKSNGDMEGFEDAM